MDEPLCWCVQVLTPLTFPTPSFWLYCNVSYIHGIFGWGFYVCMSVSVCVFACVGHRKTSGALPQVLQTGFLTPGAHQVGETSKPDFCTWVREMNSVPCAYLENFTDTAFRDGVMNVLSQQVFKWRGEWETIHPVRRAGLFYLLAILLNGFHCPLPVGLCGQKPLPFVWLSGGSDGHYHPIV